MEPLKDSLINTLKGRYGDYMNDKSIPTPPIRIALMGPSGSGKTTMAKYLSSVTHIPYYENSAGLILPPEDKAFLKREYGWTESGHSDVIRLSNIEPEFGMEFQSRLMLVRKRFITNTPSFIIDRSPVDNVAYMLAQVSHLASIPYIKSFIELAVEASKKIDLFIFVHSEAPQIEDNGSRVANIYFQRMSQAIFEHAFTTYFVPSLDTTLRVLHLRGWDLENKKATTLACLNSLLYSNIIPRK